MFSKFQWGLSQRAPCTDPSGVTDKGWIVESLENSVSSQCWWAKQCSFGQNLMESYDSAERLQGAFMAKFWHETPLWGAGFSCFKEKVFSCRVSSTSTILPRSDKKELGTQPLWGRQKAAAFPPLHPDISPGSLQPPWKRSTAGFSLPASYPKKRRKKVSFPQQVLTGLAETCPREIGRSAHCTPWVRNSLVSPTPLGHQPPGLLLALSVSSHIGGQTLWRLLCSLMDLPASAFQPPGPKPEGKDLVLLSLIISTETGQHLS